MLKIWTFVDGKRGHESQTAGLVAALANRVQVETVEIPVEILPSFPGLVMCMMVRRKPKMFPAGTPDLIIGAGRRTHLPIAVARTLCGGFAVILMRPSLPMTMFDLVVVPEHDDVPSHERVMHVKGVLNEIPHTDHEDANHGLMLIGGKSSHYRWNDRQVVSQIESIVEFDRQVHWILTTSRRTPDSCLEALERITSENLEIVPLEKTNRQWMHRQYAKSSQIWVTPDSVSMIYEALSSGAIVRVFSLVPADDRGSARVVRGLRSLIEQSLVATFDQWKERPRFMPTRVSFNEAERVASVVMERLG